MPIDISELPTVAFSRNEIPVEITSDDIIATAGIKSITYIAFVNPITAGKEIPLIWAGGNVLMEAADTPDGSGLQFPSGDGGAVHVTGLVDVFAAQYDLGRDFEISYELYSGSPSLKLLAKQPGTKFNIATASDTDVVVVAHTAGVNEARKINFRHFLQVWLEVAGSFINIYEHTLQLDFPFTGKTTKNIAEILHPYLPPGFANNNGSDRPSLSSAAWQACTKTILPYYLRIAQSFGEKPVIKKITTTAQAFVNIGGLAIQTAAVTNLIAFLRPDDEDDSQTLCLLQGSKVKKVQPAQPEFLYWLNLTEATQTIKVKFEVFFNEGGSVVFYSATQSAAAYTKYAIAVGYTTANVASHLPVGKTCAYYQATIVTHEVDPEDEAPLSVTYNYEMDVYREWPRYFVYRNSLGGFQTLYTWGKGQEETTRSKQDYILQLTDAETAVTGRNQETDIRLQVKQTVYTGYTTKRDIKLLKDFFVADEKYLVHGTGYVPISIASDTLTEAMDGDNLNGASFEYQPKYDEIVYTDDPAQADNENTAYVPDLGNIYFGAVAAFPANEAAVLTLSSSAYANETNYETGTAYRRFAFALQEDKNIVSVTDEDAVIGGNLTLLFTLRYTFAVAGRNYRIFGMELGDALPDPHTLKFITT